MEKINKTLLYINPAHKRSEHVNKRYILWFGACAPTYLCVEAYSLDEAFDTAIDYCRDHFPGLLCTNEVNEAYADAIADGKDEDEAHELSTMDMVSGGNYGDYVQSWECGVYAENATRAHLKAFERVTVGEVYSRGQWIDKATESTPTLGYMQGKGAA